MKREFEWDGEKIKEKKVEEEKKHSPKDILNSLANVRNSISQMEGQKIQMQQQMTIMEGNLASAIAFEKDLKTFEDKCVELQKEKLKFYINQLSAESIETAKKNSAAIISKDLSAYTEDQKKNLHYVEYQKLLATNSKVAENISRQIIHAYLYETPIYENPFK